MDQFQITNQRNSPHLMRFGIHLQARFPHFSVRPELTYSTTSYVMLVRNLSALHTDWSAFSVQEKFRRVELYIPVGFSVKNFMFEIGPVGGRRIFQQPTDTQLRRFSGKILPEETLLRNISRSFHTWNLDWRAGLRMSAGPLSFSLAYQANLTPIGSSINHKGSTFRMEHRNSQLMLGAGLQLLRW